MSKSITISSISSIESISLWLSISITLSIVSISVSVSISMTISKTVSNGVCTMSKSITISSISSIESLWLSISITLGNMDNTSRVGNISASTRIGTMDSRDSSRGNTMDAYSVGNIGNTISMVDRDSMVDRGNMMGSIAKMSYTIAKMMASNAIQSISISSSKGCSTSQQSNPDHVVWRMILKESH